MHTEKVDISYIRISTRSKANNLIARPPIRSANHEALPLKRHGPKIVHVRVKGWLQAIEETQKKRADKKSRGRKKVV